MHRLRQLVRLVILVAFVIDHAGVPVPQLQQLVAGRAYPCQGRSCGCQSAAQCWSSCCCTSLDERLAWAAANNVTPPASIAAAQDDSRKATKRACCQAHEPQSTHSETAHLADSVDPGAKRTLRWVTTLQSMKCRGSVSYWVGGCDPAIVVNHDVTCASELSAIDALCYADDVLVSRGYEPPTPPG